MNGNTHDQLLDKHSFSNTSTTEEANLSTASIWSQEIHDLDTGNQDFSRCSLFDELGGISVNRQPLGGFDGSSLINWVTSDVHDTA